MLSPDELWIYYGIVPGPVHNNFEVCEADCYVATFEYQEQPVDVYIVNSEFEPSILWREDSEWEGSYGSMLLSGLIGSKDAFSQQIISVLLAMGKFSWTKRR